MRIIPILFLYLVFANFAMAHGGGLDGLGCHRNRMQGGYHCHRGLLAGQEFFSKDEALNKHPIGEEKLSITVSGKARVVDGDTIYVDGIKIRLHGIDAPESKQVCYDSTGKVWKAGQYASAFLKSLTEGKVVSCLKHGRDKYGRVIGTCGVGGVNLNKELVRVGLAMAYRQYSMRYVGEEASARKLMVGMWGQDCDPPWEWRRK
jgi:endonuclease YncB( thermonuclease family)